jgi:hypothetical protein
MSAASAPKNSLASLHLLPSINRTYAETRNVSVGIRQECLRNSGSGEQWSHRIKGQMRTVIVVTIQELLHFLGQFRQLLYSVLEPA